ncbi:SHC-transforming protein 1, partial [Orchesella cincta]
YIGCLDVNTSMKSLDFDTRSLIAKECINQVCEAAGFRSQDRKRKIDRRVARILGIRPRLDHAGSDVHLTITSTCLKLTSLDTGSVIAVHDMPNISFASGGDATMLDFVAYVAKDSIVGRACFVLECGSGLAQDVITTVGQAFELRFKEYLQKRPPPPRIPADDPEYYNDLPGKVPPDVQAANALDTKDKIQNVTKAKNATSSRAKEPPPLNLHSNSDKELSVNLIDFEAPTPPAFGPSVEDKQLDSFLLPGSDHTNGASSLGASGGTPSSVMGTGLGLPNSPSQPPQKDPFDMQPFSTTLPQSIPADIVESQRRLLDGEIWFHGTVSRGEAEELLKHDGDFLVRESMACPGQFVLTGLQGDSPRHLLLVDPEGIVRTKDRTFDNVIHLIKYHSENCLPIISAESMVLLRNPVPRVISS